MHCSIGGSDLGGDMYPVVHIGHLAISTYGLVYAVAITVGGLVALRRLDALGLPRSRMLPATLVTVVGSMVGSVLLWWILARVAAVAGRPELFPGQSRSVFGVLLFGLPSAWFAFRLAGAPLVPAADRMVVGLPVAQAIGRLGCLLAGCCGGRPTTSWLAVNLPDEAGHQCARYPAQLLAGAADLVIFLVLLAVDRRFGAGGGSRRCLQPGQLTALYFLLYGCKRFAMEFIRLNQNVLGPFTWAHLLSALLAVAAATALIVLHHRR